MNLSVASSSCGIIVLDEASNVVDHLAYPRDAVEVASTLLVLQHQGHHPSIDAFVDGMIAAMGNDKWETCIVEVEDENLLETFKRRAGNKAILVDTSKAGRVFREDIARMLGLFDPALSAAEFFQFNRTVNIELTKNQIRFVSEQNDRLIIQAVNSIDDINRSANIYAERIREWYGYHFPELTDQLVSDHTFFLEIISTMGDRDAITADGLKALRPVSDRVAELILNRASESMGGTFSPYDVKMVQTFAKNVLDLFKTRDEIETYVDSLMEQTCPNMSALIGPLLGARLICLAGGLEALAKKPSSTIQVLGAEKALFRALKVKGDPPKHGVIFQAKEVRNAPFWQRGKIARLLAGKILIAARVDQVSKRYIGDDLINDVAKKIEEIKRKYPEKPAQLKKKPDLVKGKPYKGQGPPRSGSYRGKPGGYKGKPGGGPGPRRPGRTERPGKPRSPPRGK